jgi:hypothetical protein
MIPEVLWVTYAVLVNGNERSARPRARRRPGRPVQKRWFRMPDSEPVDQASKKGSPHVAFAQPAKIALSAEDFWLEARPGRSL